MVQKLGVWAGWGICTVNSELSELGELWGKDFAAVVVGVCPHSCTECTQSVSLQLHPRCGLSDSGVLSDSALLILEKWLLLCV